LLCPQTESLQIISNQMRRIGQHKPIPIVGRTILPAEFVVLPSDLLLSTRGVFGHYCVVRSHCCLPTKSWFAKCPANRSLISGWDSAQEEFGDEKRTART
jgi:hypothetical protein